MMASFKDAFDDLVRSLDRGLGRSGQVGVEPAVAFRSYVQAANATWHHDAFVVSRDGLPVGVRLRALGYRQEALELACLCPRPPAVRIAWSRGVARGVPGPLPTLHAAPAVDDDGDVLVCSDEADVGVLAALDAYRPVLRHTPHVVVACDGYQAIAWIGAPVDVGAVDAIATVVVGIARSSSVEAVLTSLADSAPLDGDGLAPAVALAPDHLVVGVAAGARMVARLGGLPASAAWAAASAGAVAAAGDLPAATRQLLARAGDAELVVAGGVATLTWLGIERDPGRLRAGVAALRSLVGIEGPYR
jgi:hypothetical protein